MVFPRQNLTKWDAVFFAKNTFSTCFVSPEKKLKSISTFKAPKIDFLWRVVLEKCISGWHTKLWGETVHNHNQFSSTTQTFHQWLVQGKRVPDSPVEPLRLWFVTSKLHLQQLTIRNSGHHDMLMEWLTKGQQSCKFFQNQADHSLGQFRERWHDKT